MIYFIAHDKLDLVKIGHTSGSGEARLNNLQTGNPELLRLLTTIPGGKKAEGELHSRFMEYLHRGEWYVYTGRLRTYVESMRGHSSKPTLLDDAAFMATHRRAIDAVHPTP